MYKASSLVPTGKPLPGWRKKGFGGQRTLVKAPRGEIDSPESAGSHDSWLLLQLLAHPGMGETRRLWSLLSLRELPRGGLGCLRELIALVNLQVWVNSARTSGIIPSGWYRADKEVVVHWLPL